MASKCTNLHHCEMFSQISGNSLNHLSITEQYSQGSADGVQPSVQNIERMRYTPHRFENYFISLSNFPIQGKGRFTVPEPQLPPKRDGDWINRTFSERLQLALASRGLTTGDLSPIAGGKRHPETAEEWVKGKRRPSLEKLIQVAEFLDVSLDWLLGLNAPRRASIFYVDTEEEFSRRRGRVIRLAAHTLWVQYTVGTTFRLSTEAFDDVLSQVDFQEFRLLICDPEDVCTTLMLARRRDTQRRNHKSVSEAIKDTIHELSAKATQHGKQLHVCRAPYAFPWDVVIADPDREHSEAFIALTNFQMKRQQVPIMNPSHRDDTEVLQFFVDNFKRLWRTEEEWQEEKDRSTEAYPSLTINDTQSS